jgi:hypothetical protein
MSERSGGVVERRRDGKRLYAVKVPVERPDGKPDYRWVYTDPATGTAFTTKKAAKAEHRRLLGIIEDNGDPFPEKMAVRDLVSRYVDHQRTRIRPRTHMRYGALLAEFTECIGNMDATKVRPGHVQAVLDALRRASLPAP